MHSDRVNLRTLKAKSFHETIRKGIESWKAVFRFIFLLKTQKVFFMWQSFISIQSSYSLQNGGKGDNSFMFWRSYQTQRKLDIKTLIWISRLCKRYRSLEKICIAEPNDRQLVCFHFSLLNTPLLLVISSNCV